MRVRTLSRFWLAPMLLLLAAGAALAQSAPASDSQQPAVKTEAPAVSESSPAVPPTLPAGIDKVIEKALDKKLAPIMRTLAEMQEQKVRLTDVLGGLGYIFGLVGVAAYVKCKKEDRRP